MADENEIVEQPGAEAAAPAVELSPEALGEAAAAAAAPEEPVYTPNHKYKFTDDDGEKEVEFDEWVKPLVNKDSEEKFRDLLSKAKGVDYMKSSREKTRQEKAALDQQLSQVRTTVSEVMGLKEKDLGLFFEKVGLDENKAVEYFLKKAQAKEALKDLPPELRNLYNETETLRRQNLDLQRQIEGAQGGSLAATTQLLTTQVHSITAQPELAPLVAEYDRRRGEAGAFINLVRDEGMLEHAMTGKLLPANEAVQRALKRLAMSPQVPSQGATPNGAAAAPKVITQPKPVVIPNVGNGTSAPVAKKVRSIDDLRKLAKQKQFSA